MRTLSRSALFVLLLAAAPLDDYEDELAKANEVASNVHFKWGKFLEGKKMYSSAKSQYMTSVRFNPANEEANNKLGKKYDPSTDKFEFDAGLAMKQKVLQKQDELVGEKKTKAMLDLEKKMGRDGKKVAGAFVKLGKWCSSNGREKEGVEAYRTALEYDPTHRTARKELGYEKQKEGGWVSKEQLKIRAELVDGIKGADKGNPTTTQTQTESGIGVSHVKRESKKFLFENGAGMSQDTMGHIIQHGEHALAMFEKIFGKSDVVEGKMNCIVLAGKPQHEAYIDKFHRGNAQQKKFAKDSRGSSGFPARECYYKGDAAKNQGDLNDASLQDWIVHGIIQYATGRITRHNRLWICEGMAYWFTVNMKKTAAWSCVNLAGTSAGSSGKNFQEPRNWGIQLKAMIREGEDPSIVEVVNASNFADFSADETVKGWSLVDFLMADHKDKFLQVMEALGKSADVTTEIAIKEVFGWSLADFNSKWKAFALANYE